MAVERKAAIPDPKVRKFNDSFLKNIRWIGRIYELGMMAMYKLRSRDLFSDVEKVPGMLSKRKLALRPHFSKSSREVRAVFKRAEEEEKNR
jgi:heterodisulfide reductase subunit C